MSFFDLSGHTAIITGAGRGIGAAIALRLAKAGATVAIADVDPEPASLVARQIEAEGAKAFPIALDVTSPASIRQAVGQVIERTGQLHILVNNAGIAGKSAPVWEQSDDDWQKTVDVNLTGVFFCCREVIPHMRAKGYGRIVNISSVAGKEGNPNMTAYSATKAGVIGLTKSLGKEVATDGICINAVTPAVVRTPILDQLTQEQIDYMTSRIPMRRTGSPEEIAAVVHFLSSPDCSFVTAQTYDASGGRCTY